MAVYSIENIEDIEEAIQLLNDMKSKLNSKNVSSFVRDLGNYAVQQAEQNFSQAEYDGDNDVTVSKTVNGKTARITASGNATLFIEYGTGITYGGEDVEYPDTPINARGTYGKGRGKNPKGWLYKGEPGTSGEESYKYEGYVHTYGNPSNACMYNAKKQTEQEGARRLKEVFK